ncbi:DUF6093 family protein [Micromonospora arida]
MSVEALLARGRAAAEQLMTTTCVIRRITSTSTDPFSGVVTPTYTDTYSGKCRAQQQTASGSAADVGEQALLLLRLEVQLPVSVVGLQADDEITITASPTDADLVGRVFMVRDLSHATHKTARRVGVIEVTS